MLIKYSENHYSNKKIYYINYSILQFYGKILISPISYAEGV